MAFTPFIHTDIIFITQIIVTPVLGKSHQANARRIQKSPKEGIRLKWPVQRDKLSQTHDFSPKMGQDSHSFRQQRFKGTMEKCN